MGLKSNSNKDDANDPKAKVAEIAHQRKLLDVIKQQEEEIMFLKDELDRLRARTFPSFAHLQNKADYPDERWKVSINQVWGTNEMFSYWHNDSLSHNCLES